VGVYAGAALVASDPRALHALVPASLGYPPERLDLLAVSADARAEFLAHESRPISLRALFGSSLFAHNTRVGLFAFASGLLFGIPTALLAVYNGLVLGALSAVMLRPPGRVDYLAWLLPHALPELAAVSLCTAAGLLLGRAAAVPGRCGRRAALREAGESSLLLFAGAVPLFLVAAAIEGFVRESGLATTPRLAVAGAMGALLAAGAGLVRAAVRARPADASWLVDLAAAARGSAPLPHDSGP
jgi:uncharacterized membrane protein SpoIIM required for sporulation